MKSTTDRALRLEGFVVRIAAGAVSGVAPVTVRLSGCRTRPSTSQGVKIMMGKSESRQGTFLLLFLAAAAASFELDGGADIAAGRSARRACRASEDLLRGRLAHSAKTRGRTSLGGTPV